jgi:hypothetical protein
MFPAGFFIKFEQQLIPYDNNMNCPNEEIKTDL